MAVIDARPTVVDLNVYGGDDLVLKIDVTDNAGTAFDLTGYTAAAEIRATADAPTAIAFTTSTLANTVTISLDAATTATLPLKGVWDVQVESATGVVTTLAGGKVTLYPGVTA